MNKPWKDLSFIKQVVIKPADPKQPMWVEFNEDSEWEYLEYPEPPRLLGNEKTIRLGTNCMYTVEMDYPDVFKRLVAATGDAEEAYRIYKEIQKQAPDNWADYDEGNVW